MSNNIIYTLDIGRGKHIKMNEIQIDLKGSLNAVNQVPDIRDDSVQIFLFFASFYVIIVERGFQYESGDFQNMCFIMR